MDIACRREGAVEVLRGESTRESTQRKQIPRTSGPENEGKDSVHCVKPVNLEPGGLRPADSELGEPGGLAIAGEGQHRSHSLHNIWGKGGGKSVYIDSGAYWRTSRTKELAEIIFLPHAPSPA